MNEYKETFGIGISKDVFDVHWNTGHNQDTNDKTGFKRFLKDLPKGYWVAM
jgi:hypothetical protein